MDRREDKKMIGEIKREMRLRNKKRGNKWRKK